MVKHCFRALQESGPKHRVPEIGLRFTNAADGVVQRSPTAPKSRDLRKDVPHPMSSFPTAPDLGKRPVVVDLLRPHEPVKIVRIVWHSVT